MACNFVGNRNFAWTLALLAASVIACPGFGEEYGSINNILPKSLEGVGIDQNLGVSAPLDLRFTNATIGVEKGVGETTSLRELLGSGKPVLLTLNYSNCPGMCIAQLNGLVQGLNELSSLQLGKDFLMVSLSIDPSETVSKAGATQQKYSKDLFDHHDPRGWRFWVGDKASIRELAQVVGFRYTYDEKHKQYNHPSAAIFIAPSGVVTRYVFEIGFVANTLKMAFVEAGQGQIGSPLDMIALWCSHYDANENRYSANARRLMSIGAGVFVTLGLFVSLPFWLAKRNSAAKNASAKELTRD